MFWLMVLLTLLKVFFPSLIEDTMRNSISMLVVFACHSLESFCVFWVSLKKDPSPTDCLHQMITSASSECQRSTQHLCYPWELQHNSNFISFNANVVRDTDYWYAMHESQVQYTSDGELLYRDLGPVILAESDSLSSGTSESDEPTVSCSINSSGRKYCLTLCMVWIHEKILLNSKLVSGYNVVLVVPRPSHGLFPSLATMGRAPYRSLILRKSILLVRFPTDANRKEKRTVCRIITFTLRDSDVLDQDYVQQCVKTKIVEVLALKRRCGLDASNSKPIYSARLQKFTFYLFLPQGVTCAPWMS